MDDYNPSVTIAGQPVSQRNPFFVLPAAKGRLKNLAILPLHYGFAQPHGPHPSPSCARPQLCRLGGGSHQKQFAIQKHGDWVLLAKDPASLAKLKSPDAVIAYLEKPQTEDIRFWGRASPELLSWLQDRLVQSFNAKLTVSPRYGGKHSSAMSKRSGP
jgi:hypothetical protein